jgi:putative transposase
MTSAPDRREIVVLSDESVAAGARQETACGELLFSARTFQLWKGPYGVTTDIRQDAELTASGNQLNEDERQKMVANSHDRAFAPSSEPHLPAHRG